MTPEQLKASILQYAIQGKLVEQRQEEGTGEELYQQIQQEKQRLIKEGKIKKEKPLPEITEDEIPFDIPDNWKWVRLPEVGTSSLGKTLNKGLDAGKEVPYLCNINVYWDGISLNQIKTAKFSEADKEKYLLHREDLLVCEGGDVGRSAVWNRNTEMYYQNALHCVRFFGTINPYYFKYCLELYKYNRILEKASKGMTIKHLVQGALHAIPFPLPPPTEQHRIVAKIEELLPHIDRYAVAYEKLEQFNAKFPEDMKKSILQYAIQGKLVEQRPEEGTGEELYQRIRAEKKRLIKEGKIRKEKPLPEIAEDEIPFDIPGSWKWVRFSELMNSMSTGPFGSMLHKADYVSNGIPLVNPANIINGSIIASDKMMVSEETAKRLSSYALETGMIVMGRRGEMGRCAVVGQEENGWLCGTGSFFMLPSSCVFVNYLSMFITTSYVKGYLSGASVGTTMSNLNHKILNNMPVPLPPLAEQKRIVAKLEEILPLCERLK